MQKSPYGISLFEVFLMRARVHEPRVQSSRRSRVVPCHACNGRAQTAAGPVEQRCANPASQMTCPPTRRSLRSARSNCDGSFSAPLLTLLTLSAQLHVTYALSPQPTGECNERDGHRVCFRDPQ